MKAAVYYETGGPEVFRYEDVPDPQCYPGGVLIEVEAISIEGGDTLNRTGGEMATTPHVVGYQCAGTIREVGEGVVDRKVGQRVVATMLLGSHAALAVTPAVVTWPIPDDARALIADDVRARRHRTAGAIEGIAALDADRADLDEDARRVADRVRHVLVAEDLGPAGLVVHRCLHASRLRTGVHTTNRSG